MATATAMDGRGLLAAFVVDIVASIAAPLVKARTAVAPASDAWREMGGRSNNDVGDQSCCPLSLSVSLSLAATHPAKIAYPERLHHPDCNWGNAGGSLLSRQGKWCLTAAQC